MHSLSEITQQLLHKAQIAHGMRVLDIGCGGGEVTRAVADIVGSTGGVVGIDGSASAIANAEATTDQNKYRNITFVLSDLTELKADLGDFDCIVCRRVLMYIPQPANVIAQLIPLLRPGGRIAIQEHDSTMTPANRGHWPIHDKVHYWL